MDMMGREIIECQQRKRYAKAGMTLVVTASMREDLLPRYCFFAAIMDDRTDRAEAGHWIYVYDFDEDSIWGEAEMWADAWMAERFGE